LIRAARVTDAKNIQRLVNYYGERGEMLALSLHEVFDSLRDFSVYEAHREIVGTCALQITWEDLAEVRSLAVSPKNIRQGIGSQLLLSKIREARDLGLSKLFALSYNPGFFQRHGFRLVDKGELPHKVWVDCVKCIKFPDCTEVALVLNL